MMHLIECYAHSNRLRMRHPLEKVAFAGGLLALSLILPFAGAILVLLVISGCARWVAGIPWKGYLRMLAAPVAFLALGGLSLIISLSVDAGGLHLALARDQMPYALRLMARALAAAACLCFLGLTTPALDWLPLLRRLRIPAAVIDIMLVVYRLLFILVERLAAMLTAQNARLGYASVRNTFRSSGLMGANLLVFALKRARGMERGMASRGFSAEIPLLPLEGKPSPGVLFLIVMIWGVVAGIGFSIQRWWFNG